MGEYVDLPVRLEAGLGPPGPTLTYRLEWELSPWVLQGLLTSEPLLRVFLHQVPYEIFG